MRSLPCGHCGAYGLHAVGGPGQVVLETSSGTAAGVGTQASAAREPGLPIEITLKRGDAVLLSRADFDALNETAWLLRAPANARRLLESLAQAKAGEREEHELT